MLNLATFRLLALGIAVLAYVSGCGEHKQPALQGSLLRRGLSGEPSTLDPAAVSDTFSGDVVRDTYQGLTMESSTGEAIPGVASGWTVDASGTLYTFTLRSDARWSNGKPVQAQDFVRALRRAVDPKEGSPAADNLRLISGASEILGGKASTDSLRVSAPSAGILQIKLVAPAAYFPLLLSNTVAFPIFSADTAKRHDATGWVSNGAYVLESWNPGSSIRLKRNEYYWDKAHVQISEVEYQFSAEEASQFARFRSGGLDMTDSVPANEIQGLRASHSPELMLAPYLATAYYGLNLAEGPTAHSLQLRQALNMAIDRQRLVDALGFGQTPAYGFLPEGIWNYTPQSFPWKSLTDEARVAEAQRLYKAAGFSPNAPLNLRLLYNSNPIIRQTAVIVADMWKKTLGVNVELTGEEYRVFLDSRHNRSRWDVVRLSWSADFNDASNFLDIFGQNSANNDEAYRSPIVDDLLTAAERSVDAVDRRELLQKAEITMLNDYPIIPLYFFVSKRLVKPYVLGLHPSPLNSAPSSTLRVVPANRAPQP